MRSVRKKLLFLKVKLFISGYWDIKFNEDILNTCGSLLLDGKGTPSYDLYDLMVVATALSKSNNTENTRSYMNLVEDYTKKHSEYNHIINIQKILLNNERLTSLSATALIEINLLLSDFYSETNVACVTSEGAILHSSIHPKYKLSAYDIVLIACGIERVSTIDNGRIFSDTASRKIITLYTEQFGKLFIPDMKVYIDRNASTVLTHILNCGCVINTANLFMVNTIVDNNILQTLGWEREYVSKDSDNFATTMFAVLSNMPKDIAMHRKFYIRDKGVTVRFINPMDSITSIHMTEVHNEDANLHYIAVHGKVEEATRSIYIPMDNFSHVTFPLLYEKDYVLILHVLYVLGLLPVIIQKITSKDFKFPKEFDSEIAEVYIQTIKNMSEQFNNLEYVFEEPYWWNYDTNSQNKTNSVSKGARVEKRVSVGRYVRALPEGQKASEEAKSLAKKYRLILEPGYTLVDDFEKNVTIKI